MFEIYLPKSRFKTLLKDEIEKMLPSSSKWQLKRLKTLLKIIDELPAGHLEELEKVFNKVYYKHQEVFTKMGYKSAEELIKEPWLFKFYRWSVKASKLEGQKLSLGGKILELIVKNDKDLHNGLERIVKARHAELIKNNFFPMEVDKGIKASTHVIEGIKDYVPIKATDLTAGGKQFLDFAHFLYNEKTKKVIIIIEGQIKREGAVQHYVEQALSDTKRIFKSGFDFVIDGKKVTIKPEDVMIDEFLGSKVLVTPAVKKPLGSQMHFSRPVKWKNPSTNKIETLEVSEMSNVFLILQSRSQINNMLDDLFQAKLGFMN